MVFSSVKYVGPIALGLCLCGGSAFAATFAPDPVLPSSLTLQIEEVGALENGSNLASPVVVDGDLYIIDQQGAILRKEGDSFNEVFSAASDTPAGLSLTGNEKVLNIADGPGDKVYIALTSSTLPSDEFGFFDLPEGTGVSGEENLYSQSGTEFQVVYSYTRNPTTGAFENPQALTAFEVASSGHSGGGMLVLPDGRIVFATGDSLQFDRDGRFAPQDEGGEGDALEHVGKLLLIDPDTGDVELAAKGTRNVQRLTYADDTQTTIAFGDIGAATAEEINIISTVDLADTSEIENFGWGREWLDGETEDAPKVPGLAREGLFYINEGASGGETSEAIAIADAPLGEDGFIQPYAQFGRPEGSGFFAVSGPVFSEVSFHTIAALFGDLSKGGLYATIGALSGVANDVFAVNLVDIFGDPTTLLALNDRSRDDPRFFQFADGGAGVLLERSGKIYRLTELKPSVVPLPAAGWLLIGSVGGIFLLRRRDKKRG